MTVAIDSNIIFDILLPDPKYHKSSLDLLVNFATTDKLIISEIVYGELSSQFRDKNLLDSFLNDANIILEHTPTNGLWIASRAWKKYTSRRSEKLQCSKCGSFKQVKCKKCGSTIKRRQHIISDFIIGGHAASRADKLMTRDRGFYRSYFKELKLIN